MFAQHLKSLSPRHSSFLFSVSVASKSLVFVYSGWNSFYKSMNLKEVISIRTILPSLLPEHNTDITF